MYRVEYEISWGCVWSDYWSQPQSWLNVILQIFIVCQYNMPKAGAYYGFYKCAYAAGFTCSLSEKPMRSNGLQTCLMKLKELIHNEKHWFNFKIFFHMCFHVFYYLITSKTHLLGTNVTCVM